MQSIDQQRGAARRTEIGGRIAALATAPAAVMAVALAVGLVATLAGCRDGASPTPPERGETAAVHMNDRPTPSGFRALAVENSPTSMVVHLRWQGDAPGASDSRAVAFCLPAGQQFRAKWLEASLNGEPLTIGAANGQTAGGKRAERRLSPTGGSVQFLGYLRNWPIHRLTLSRDVFDPLRGAAASDGGGEPVYDLTLELSWKDPLLESTSAVAYPNPGTREAWRRIAESVVLNPDDLDRFAVTEFPWPADLPQSAADPRASAPGERSWARLEIGKQGLVRIEMRELQRVGFPAARTTPENVRVYSHGHAVPVLVAPGENVPRFVPPGAYIWARGGSGPYSNTRTYWVTLAEDAPAARLTMAEDVPTPDQAQEKTTVLRRWERDRDEAFRTRHGRFMAFLGMRWAEAELENGRALAIPVTLPWLAPSAGNARLTFDFFVDRERTMQGARVRVGVGDHELETLQFTGIDDATRRVDAAAELFGDGSATTVTLLMEDDARRVSTADETGDGDSSGVWFDRIEAVYPSFPRLTDGRLTIGTDATLGGPAWVVLTDWAEMPDVQGWAPPTAFALKIDRDNEAQALWPLQHDGQGRTGVVAVADKGARLEFIDPTRLGEAPRLQRVVWEELIDPEEGCELLIVTHAAFREQAERLAVHRRGQGRTTRVVDVQCVYDQFSDGESSPLAIRAMLAHALRRWRAGAPSNVLLVGDTTADYLGEARNGVLNWVPTYTYNDGGDTFASDYWFTTVTGNDPLGDYMIGRLSVTNSEDLRAIVDKLVAYDEQPRPGPWRARLGYIADQGEFSTVLDELRREGTPEAYEARTVYLPDYPMQDNWILALQLVESKDMKVSAQATDAIARTFREGVSYLSYYGHGSPNIWSNERMWFGGDSSNSDNLMLTGSGIYSFVANMTCNSGAIDYPLTQWNVCITEDLLRVRDGGAIACYVPSGPSVTIVHKRMSEALREMMFERGMRSLGELVTTAKARYLINGNPDELPYMYLLLGDPTTRLQLTDRLGGFEIPNGFVAPGGGKTVTLTGIEPARGKWSAELTSENNRRLWSGEGSVAEGRATMRIDAPSTASAGQAVLKVYCWDASSPEKDVALSGSLAIETPYVTLGAMTAANADGGTEADAVEVTVEVVNPTHAPGSGRLEAWIEDDAGSRTLLEQSVAGAGKHSFKAPAPASGASYIGMRLRSENPADDPAIAQTVVRRGLLSAPGKAPAALLGPLCALERDARIQHGTLKVKAVVDAQWLDEVTSGGALLAAGIDGAASATLATAILKFMERETVGRVEGPLTRRIVEGEIRLEDARAETLAGGRLWLARRTGEDGGRDERIDSVALESIETLQADPWIVEETIVLRPASPVEGETVFIDCTVGNRGTLAAPATTLRLLESPPWEGGRAVSTGSRGGSVRVPALAPGRTARITLRWDPVDNVGANNLWLQLMSRPGRREPGPDDQVREIALVARSKPKLKAGRSWTEADERDRRYHRVRIHAEVINEGQSEAHNTMVAFYRSRVQVEENKLSEVLLETVPAEGSAVASHTWEYDPQKDLVRGGQLPEPTVKVWLKGSVRPPVSNVVDGE